MKVLSTYQLLIIGKDILLFLIYKIVYGVPKIVLANKFTYLISVCVNNDTLYITDVLGILKYCYLIIYDGEMTLVSQ